MKRVSVIVFLIVAGAATSLSSEEPGGEMLGVTFKQTFPKVGTLTGKVTDYIAPSTRGRVETKGLYKVDFSDGNSGLYYYGDLLQNGAKIPEKCGFLCFLSGLFKLGFLLLLFGGCGLAYIVAVKSGPYSQ